MVLPPIFGFIFELHEKMWSYGQQSSGVSKTCDFPVQMW